MNETTLTALQGSIKKWQSIVAGEGVDDGWTNCSLCKIFIHSDCVRCPVAEDVSESVCGGTPYERWEALAGEYGVDYPRKISDFPEDEQENARELAVDELNYLKSLLPNFGPIEVVEE